MALKTKIVLLMGISLTLGFVQKVDFSSEQKKHNEQYKSNAKLVNFWSNLKTGYDKFHNNFNELIVSVDKTSGEYRF